MAFENLGPVNPNAGGITPQALAQAAGIEYTPGMGYDEFQKRIAQKQAIDGMKAAPPPGLGPPPNAIKDVDTNVPPPVVPTSFRDLAVANAGPVQQKALKLEGVPAIAPGGPQGGPGPGLGPPAGPAPLDLSGLKATPGTLIAGHTAPTMSKEQAKADIGALSAEKQAELHGNEASIATSNVANQENVGLAGTQHQLALEARAAEDRRQAALNQHFDRRTAMMEDIRSSKVDPDHFFGTGAEGAFKRVATVLAMAMGGYAAGLRGGPNMAAQIIEDGINRDIDAQKHEISKKQGLLEEHDKGYGQKLQQFGDERVAEAAERADKYSAAKALAESHIADAKTDEQRANGEKLAAHFDGLIAKEDRVINKWQPPQVVGGMSVGQKLDLIQKAQNIEKGQAELGKTAAETAKIQAQAAAGGTGGKDRGLPGGQITQISKAKNVVRILDQEIAMRKGEGKYAGMSEADKMALSEKNKLSLANDIVAYQTGGVPDVKSKEEKLADLPTSRGRLQRANAFANPFAADPLKQLEYERELALDAIKGIEETSAQKRGIGVGGDDSKDE